MDTNTLIAMTVLTDHLKRQQALIHETLELHERIPDEKKAGGRYNTVTAQVKRIDSTNQKMILITKDQPDLPDTIPFDRILDLQGDILNDLDN